LTDAFVFATIRRALQLDAQTLNEEPQTLSPQPRQIRLTFPETGESVLADLLEQDAPHVCDQVWSLLPLEKKMIHGMYSGPEVFMVLDKPQAVPLENEVQLPLPGEILYFYDPGTSAGGGNRAVSEICVVYGRGVSLKQHDAVPTLACAFARIRGDWTRDWTDFAAACRRVRTERTARLRIERV
jgi:Protein of unknown function (DUF3830)